MPKDVIITPASGKLDFYATTGGSVLANINLTDNNDLSLSTTSGNLIIGDASRDVYIGDGTNEVDIVFEQNGEIRSVAGKYITVNAGTVNATGVAVNTSSPTAVMHVYGSTPSGTVLNVEGTNGSLFSVVDDLDGTLMSVNNNAGLPVLEVFSDDRIVGGRFGQNDFVVSSSGNVGVGLANPSTKLEVSGTIKATDFSGIGSSLTAGYAQNIVGEAGGGYSATILPPWGAIPYISENGTTIFRTIGGANQVLKSNGDNPVWGSVQYSEISGTVPTWNQNTTGTAANITASSNTTLTTLSNLVSVGTIATGVWSASTIDVNKGGTGATTFTSGEILVGNGTDAVSTLSRSGIDSRSTFPPSTHSITEHSATAWRMFFSNATTSAIQELAFGDAGTFLKSAGASSNPTWSTLTSSDVGLGNVANVAALPLTGGTLTGTIVITGSPGVNGQIYLNNSSNNRLDFNTNGVSTPSLFTVSPGTKIRLYPSLATNTATDFAIGLAGDGFGGGGTPTRFWQSVDTANSRFEWFAGSTTIGTLTGSGVLTIQGATSQINVDNLRLDGNTLSATNGSLSLNPSGTSSIFLGDSGLIEFRPSSNRFIMSDSGPEIICDFNESSCLFRKSSGGGATVALFIDRSSSTATVGINTNTPSEALEVNGTIKATSLNIGSSNTLDVANTYGSIIGGYQSKASMYGEVAHAAGGFANVHGTAQHRILVARGITLSGAFTVTIASPAVFTRNGHSLSVGDTVTLSTTGYLPTGLNTTTTYYVISSGLTGSTFQLSTTLNGSPVNTSGTQSGTHTLVPSTSLTLNGAIGLTTPQLMVIPARSAWAYTIKISAYNSQNNQGAAYHAFGGLRRNVSTTLELETTNGFTYLESSFNTTPALVSINADTTNNALDIRVTGIANQSTRWVAVVDLVQVSYGTP